MSVWGAIRDECGETQLPCWDDPLLYVFMCDNCRKRFDHTKRAVWGKQIPPPKSHCLWELAKRRVTDHATRKCHVMTE